MATPRRLGYHADSKRDVYLLTLDSLGAPYTLPEIEVRHFVCLCALDAEPLADEELGAFCLRLLELGCVYLCAWGQDCKRVHDIMDEQVVGDNPPQSYLGCVMTTWRAPESLDDALWYFLECTVPDAKYAPDGCQAGLVITFAGSDWNEAIEQHVSTELG